MEKERIMLLRVYIQRFIRLFGLLDQTVTPCGVALSVSQVHALQELEKEPISVTKLSEKLGLERSSVSRLADQLVKAGFIIRVENEVNRREVILSLTEKGEKSIANVREQSISFLQTIVGEMTKEQQEQLLESFSLFTTHLAKVRGEKQ